MTTLTNCIEKGQREFDEKYDVAYANGYVMSKQQVIDFLASFARQVCEEMMEEVRPVKRKYDPNPTDLATEMVVRAEAIVHNAAIDEMERRYQEWVTK